jgi:hypothetical protein
MTYAPDSCRRHVHVPSTRVQCTGGARAVVRHVHKPSTAFQVHNDYEHVVAVMTERLRREEFAAELDPLPVAEIRMRAYAMASRRVENISFYRAHAEVKRLRAEKPAPEGKEWAVVEDDGMWAVRLREKV